MSNGIYNIFGKDTLEERAFYNSDIFVEYHKKLKNIKVAMQKEEEENRLKKVAQTTDSLDRILRQAELTEEQLFGGEIGEKLEQIKSQPVPEVDLEPELYESGEDESWVGQLGKLEDSLEDAQYSYKQDPDKLVDELSFKEEPSEPSFDDEVIGTRQPELADEEEDEDFWAGVPSEDELTQHDMIDEDYLNKAEASLGLNFNASYILSKLEKRGF